MIKDLELLASGKFRRWGCRGNNFDRSATGLSWENKVLIILTYLQAYQYGNCVNGPSPRPWRIDKLGRTIHGVHVHEMVALAIKKDMFPGKNPKEIETGIRTALSSLKSRNKTRLKGRWGAMIDKWSINEIEDMDPHYEQTNTSPSRENGGWYVFWEKWNDGADDPDTSLLWKKWEELKVLAGGRDKWWIYFMKYVFVQQQ